MDYPALVIVTVLVTAAALIAYRVLAARSATPATGEVRPLPDAPSVRAFNIKTTMMVLVSVAVLASSLYIVLSDQYDSESQKWAFGVIGTLLGFWLRPESS
jgi:hypothetical protein